MLRNFVVLVLLAVPCSWALTSQAGDGPKSAPYMHAVIFYVKKDAPKGTTKAIIEDSHKLLAKIPSVKQLWVGRPAKEATPKVAVTDYEVGLTISFENYEGLKTYLDHDLHTQFVDKHMKHIEKVLVYDFINEMK